MTMRWARNLVTALLLCGAAGCATTAGTDPRDPLEGFNRAVYSFNDGFDQAIGKPIATGYRDLVPDPVRGWVRNFFANIYDLWTGFNNLIQGKPADAVTDWARFAFNSTLGIFGFNDVATSMGLEKHDEDFGQTLGWWGVPSGPYLVIPLLGPSSARDAPAKIVDPQWYWPRLIDNDRVYWSLWTFDKVRQRANLLKAESIVEQAALDRYTFIRDAWIQRRRNQVFDGHPPPLKEDED
jgi:phospholipid-binding lipoprotein MlaA